MRDLSDITRDWVGSLLFLFYPSLCVSCEIRQPIQGTPLCVRCSEKLPFCNFPDLTENLISQRLFGRVSLNWASACLYYKAGSKVQRLLHQFKYKNRRDIGRFFGKKHASQIKAGNLIAQLPDVIIPVPLHPKKLHQRGFNQSAEYGAGLSDGLQIPLDVSVLLRERFTQTQTRKSKAERLMNVKDAFRLSNPEKLAGKHILLVDDVFTSGATMESCMNCLMSIPGIKISIATLAISDEW